MLSNVPLLRRMQDWSRNQWLKAVKGLNASMASVFTAVSAAYAAYPDSVKGFLKQLPEWLIFPAAVGFFWFVHHAIKRAQKPGS